MGICVVDTVSPVPHSAPQVSHQSSAWPREEFPGKANKSKLNDECKRQQRALKANKKLRDYAARVRSKMNECWLLFRPVQYGLVFQAGVWKVGPLVDVAMRRDSRGSPVQCSLIPGLNISQHLNPVTGMDS